MPKRSLKKRGSRRVRNSRRYMKKGGTGVVRSNHNCGPEKINEYKTKKNIKYDVTGGQYCRDKFNKKYDSCDTNGQLNTISEDRTPYCYRIEL